MEKPPQQVPQAIQPFVGRDEELAVLNQLCDPTSGCSIAVITGSPGMGKTALARKWAHEMADRFPDGQLYVDLSGFADKSESQRQPSDVLREFLSALRVPAEQLLVDPGGPFRSAVSGLRLLIVLDNARDLAQVEPLLPGSTSCSVVVTSRYKLTSLATKYGATLIPLETLSTEESRQYLRLQLRQAADNEPDAVAGLVDECGRHPLALSIIAARAREASHGSLNDILVEVRTERLDSLTEVRAIFFNSYQQPALAEVAPLFRLFALNPRAEMSLEAISSLAGDSTMATRRKLRQLTDASLLSEIAKDRFEVHDLLHEYAKELAEQYDGDEVKQPAMRRLLDHYVQTGFNASRQLNPERDPIVLADIDPTSVTACAFTSAEEAFSWFHRELPTIRTIFDHTVRHHHNVHTWQLAWSLMDYFRITANHQYWLTFQRAALKAARATRDDTVVAHRMIDLGNAYYSVFQITSAAETINSMYRRIPEMDRHLRTGFEEFSKTDPQRAARILEAMKQFNSASASLAEAKREIEELGMTKGGFAGILAETKAADLGAETQRCYTDALDLFRKLNDQRGETVALACLKILKNSPGQPKF